MNQARLFARIIAALGVAFSIAGCSGDDAPTVPSTFTIGGTLSGLSGTGLVLQNNGASDLTVAPGATSFAFPATVSAGAAYSVSVRTQPSSPAQTCAVASGSGTASANVTNVAVTCTTNTYNIGGTIAGLTGNGFTLRLNGGTPLAIAAGATTFVFPTVASGTAYTITVGTQPSGPAQTCTITNATGTLGGANITNVAISCAVVINGTVAGLAGSGLVLQNNGGDDLTVAASATTFAFATPVAPGAAYNVSVRTQPTTPSQSCAVANGVGTATASAPSIAVTCTTSSFAVGGTIAGLTGSGLALRLNGGTPLTIAAGATSFAFPAIPSGTAYTVTVSTPPGTPAQTCTVANPTGTVGSGAVTNIAVTCVTLTVGGTVTGLTGAGLSVRINGGTPLAIPAGATSMAFPNVFVTGNDYRVTIATQPASPAQTCTLQRGQGRVASTVVSNVAIACVVNNTSPLSGTYTGGAYSYLTFWPDGTFAYAERNDEPSCRPGNGNGIEYGVYNWNATTKAFTLLSVPIDTHDGCGGLNDPLVPFPAGVTLTKSGANLVLALPNNAGTLTVTPVPTTAGSLIGSFSGDDGNDGSFVIFQADGTYFTLDPQLGTGNGALIGFERGCYTTAGGTFTPTLAATCRPDGKSAIDINGTGGFSNSAGAPTSFFFSGPNALLIGGARSLTRIPFN